MHYLGNDISDNDDERDMQLPFKKLDIHPSQVLFMASVREINVLAPERHSSTRYHVYQHQYFPNPALASPFRPPCV